jgi:hypothetical protein
MDGCPAYGVSRARAVKSLFGPGSCAGPEVCIPVFAVTKGGCREVIRKLCRGVTERLRKGVMIWIRCLASKRDLHSLGAGEGWRICHLRLLGVAVRASVAMAL